jgi:prolyl-tRNA synthetase
MKDAYSFDSSWEGLDESYKLHDKAYRNIFTRNGLKFFTVTAFSGAMGGSDSEEFMVETDAGEDNVVLSSDNKYASNLEVAVSYSETVKRNNNNLPLEELYTPNIKTIEELADFLGTTDKSRLAKSRVFIIPADKNIKDGKDEYIEVLVCGDDEVSETKLQNKFSGIRPAHPEELLAITGADAGSIGPVGVSGKIKVIADLRLRDADELVSGANKNDYHYKNIDLKRDVEGIEYYDIRTVKEGEYSADKSSSLRITKAIEVGHIFKLGTKYAEALGAKFLDKNGKEQVVIMGSYGIGIERIAAAYIEQNYDKDGIIWGGEISPFKVHLICVNTKIEQVKSKADEIYNELEKNNIEVLYDDRLDISPGFKFKDADLLGMPVQLIISEKNIKNNEAEIKIRRTGERIKSSLPDVIIKIKELLNQIK